MSDRRCSRLPGTAPETIFGKVHGQGLARRIALGGIFVGVVLWEEAPVFARDWACAAELVPVVSGGGVSGCVSPVDAVRSGLTVLDLGDGWLPGVFSESPEAPQRMRPHLLGLASERIGRGAGFAQARLDRHFELFGVSPSVTVVRRRLADHGRHLCHEAIVEDGALGPLKGVLASGPRRGPDITAAVSVMQAHLRCEGLLGRRARAGVFDRHTAAALTLYQRRHMLADHGRLDRETRIALVTDSRELDFRALLRVLRERVADAAGLIEDGSAGGGPGEVLERVLDSAEFREGFLRAASTPPAGEPAPESDRGGDRGGRPRAGVDLAGGGRGAGPLRGTSPEAVVGLDPLGGRRRRRSWGWTRCAGRRRAGGPGAGPAGVARAAGGGGGAAAAAALPRRRRWSCAPRSIAARSGSRRRRQGLGKEGSARSSATARP